MVLSTKERLQKNIKIKESMAKTKAKRLTQRCRVIELKLNHKKLGKTQYKKLKMIFVQCKWLYNYLLSLQNEDLINFDTKTSEIFSLDKDKNKIKRELNLPAQIKQTVYQVLCNNMKSLKQLKEHNRKIGKLKFKSEYNSIDLKQYGNSHKILPNNRIRLSGLGVFRVHGMNQIKEDWEFANAKLIQKPSGFYLLLTCYENLTLEKTNKPNYKTVDCGLDFGIKTNITTSDGEKFDVYIEESERLKNLQRKLARQMKGSNNYKRTLHKIQIEYEKMSNIKKEKTNKLVAYLCGKYNHIYIQDEMIKAWHRQFGKEVQHSFMGKVKSKLQEQSNVFVIDRHYPTTKMCYNCGTLHKNITLNDREFVCPSCGFSEDRDIKAAKTVMFIGQCKFTATEHSRSSNVERMSDFLKAYAKRKQSSKKLYSKEALEATNL